MFELLIAFSLGIILIYIVINDYACGLIKPLFVVDDPGSLFTVDFIQEFTRTILQGLFDLLYF